MKTNFFDRLAVLTILLASSILLGCGTFTSLFSQKNAGTPDAGPSKTPFSNSSLAPIPTSSLNDPDAASMAFICHNTVNGLYSLKKGLSFPDHLYANPLRQDTDFDVNENFKVLTHLSLAPGYSLDYLYYSAGSGGKPLIYARKSADMPIKSYNEFLKSVSEARAQEASFKSLKNNSDYLRQVQVDGSAAGYYQYIVLALLGDQFYLNGYGSYDDTRVLCSPDDLSLINADLDFFKIKLPEAVINGAKTIDYRPLVLISDQTVTVRLVTFTKWGGFFESVYVLDRQKPYRSTQIQHNELIKYDCGISF